MEKPPENKELFLYRAGVAQFPSMQRETWDEVTQNRVWDTIYAFAREAASDRYSNARNFIDAGFGEVRSLMLKTTLEGYFGVFRFNVGTYWVNIPDAYRALFFHGTAEARLAFVEIIARGDKNPRLSTLMSEKLNAVFEEWHVAYRLVNGRITDIDDKKEREAVEAAVRESAHIEKAIALLYNRDKPDYENSIKESISAVEEICREITGKPKATLGDCLRVIDDKAQMHGAFKEALTKLYGYTSDESGIRHAGLSGGEVAFEEAKFMLVACSAFCNYLRAKQTKL